MKKRLRYTAMAMGITIIFSACQARETEIAGTTWSEANADKSPITSEKGTEGFEESLPDRESLPEEFHSDNTSLEDASNYYKLPEKERPKVRVLDDLGLHSDLLAESFYQSGNINSQLHIYVNPVKGGDLLDAEQINILFSMIDPNDEVTNSLSASAEISVEWGKNTYDISLEIDRLQDGSVTQAWSQDAEIFFGKAADSETSRIEIKNSHVFDGIYYPESSYEGIELTKRYLSRVELSYLPTEMLGIMRNSVYAFHGRKFHDPVLQEYFDNRFWYTSNIEPSYFSADTLTKIEQANIQLIRELEQEPSDVRTHTAYKGPDGTDFAPYLDFLDLNQETGITVNLKEAEDIGEFWVAPGQIYLPVTMTRSQWEEVQNGGQAELVTDELTEETKVLEYNKEKGYFLYDKGKERTENTDQQVSVRYNYGTGFYELWQMSDDTIMKQVYEGEIWVVKGAVTGSDVSAPYASMNQKEMTVPKEDSDISGIYVGNWLIHDGRGHVLVLYSLGD